MGKKAQARKENTPRKKELVLAYDLGGTKVACGVINDRGQVLDQVREHVDFNAGQNSVFDQLERLGKHFMDQYPAIKKAGMGSAGPLHPETGSLLNPTNFGSGKKKWGEVPIGKIMSKRLGIPLRLENDAAAAALAEYWVGSHAGCPDLMIVTLGTGLGAGAIVNHRLCRSGFGLHPEAGHLIIQDDFPGATCGCGNAGCAEGILSGSGFGRWASSRMGLKNADAKKITGLAKAHHKQALESFRVYSKLLARTLQNYCVVFGPRVILFSGSFAAAAPLFLPETRLFLKDLLKTKRVQSKDGIDLLPRLGVSSLKNDSGLIGAGFVGLFGSDNMLISQ